MPRSSCSPARRDGPLADLQRHRALPGGERGTDTKTRLIGFAGRTTSGARRASWLASANRASQRRRSLRATSRFRAPGPRSPPRA
ncbi:MAG TPA: hypothetical protein VKY86_12075 [Promicromonospora sp.]|nr:hypothetical protein [Promicromonospora sp.]